MHAHRLYKPISEFLSESLMSDIFERRHEVVNLVWHLNFVNVLKASPIVDMYISSICLIDLLNLCLLRVTQDSQVAAVKIMVIYGS
jgi:hypothetical protein